MKVAVIGAGGVGSYYGALLARAGHEVWFHMRRDLDAVRAGGLSVRSYLGDFAISPVAAVADPREIGPADLVVCSLKATALADAQNLVEPCVGPHSRLLLLMNGFGIEEQFTGLLPAARVFGGMAFVCINRGRPGVVHHLDYGQLTIGNAADDAEETARLCAEFAAAEIDALAAPCLRRARWEKLCWNIPFSGIGVAAGGVGTATVLGRPYLRDLARDAIHDIVGAANADIQALDARAEPLDARAAVDSMFSRTATMGDYRASMVIDFVRGQPIEEDAILGSPLRRAGELGVAVPTVRAIHAFVLSALAVRDGDVIPYTRENVAASLE